MSIDVPGPSRSRRRYMPGSARSKTIELGTLSEIEEDMYQNRKDLDFPPPPPPIQKSQDDSAVGTIRRPTKGSVRSLARHLSERHKADKASHLARKAAADREPSEECKKSPERRNSVSTEECQEEQNVKLRQFAQEMRINRAVSERREPLSKWSPTESADEKWSMPAHPSTMYPEFHMRPPSTVSRHGSMMAAPPLNRSSSMAGRVLMYDPRTMSLVDPRLPPPCHRDKMMPEYGVPVWYPPPQPVYIPIGAPMIPYSQKMPHRQKPRSACADLCCGGAAQFLWIIISILLFGVVATLALALFYV